MSADTGTLRAAFARTFGRETQVVSEAPGRVNLIGEHTDYNCGFVLPIAINRSVAVAAAARDDRLVRTHSVDFAECDEFPLQAIERAGGWRDYVRGVAWALAEGGHSLRGCELAITGDVPRGSGLSSSAALEVAVAAAFGEIAAVGIAPRDLALL